MLSSTKSMYYRAVIDFFFDQDYLVFSLYTQEDPHWSGPNSSVSMGFEIMQSGAAYLLGKFITYIYDFLVFSIMYLAKWLGLGCTNVS